MKKVNLLSKAEMKKVLGGVEDASNSTCGTTCNCPAGYILKPGLLYAISITCDGDCSAINETSVTCGNDLITCSSHTNTFCDLVAN